MKCDMTSTLHSDLMEAKISFGSIRLERLMRKIRCIYAAQAKIQCKISANSLIQRFSQNQPQKQNILCGILIRHCIQAGVLTNSC